MPSTGLALGASLSVGSPKKMAMSVSFLPTSISGLKLWLKADAGVTLSETEVIGRIVISEAGISSSNGEYVYNGNMYVGPNDNNIFNDGGDWYLYDTQYEQNTYYNGNNLAATGWEQFGDNESQIPIVENHVDTIASWLDQSSETTFNSELGYQEIVNINGRPAIGFGPNGCFRYESINEKTIICAFHTQATPSGYNCIVEGRMGMYASLAGAGGKFGTYLNKEVGFANLTEDTKYILMIESEDGQVANTGAYVNGQHYTSELGQGGFTARDHLVVGNGNVQNQIPNQPCNGFIYEVMVFDKILTQAEREQVHAYLNDKYQVY